MNKREKFALFACSLQTKKVANIQQQKHHAILTGCDSIQTIYFSKTKQNTVLCPYADEIAAFVKCNNHRNKNAH